MFRSTRDDQIRIETDEERLVVTGYRLDRVLAAVESEFGPRARIVRTDRFIAGGIKGFFGRECFTVEAGPCESASSVGTDEPLDGRTFAQTLAAALADIDSEDPADSEGPADSDRDACPGDLESPDPDDVGSIVLADLLGVDSESAVADSNRPAPDGDGSVELPSSGIVAVVGRIDDSVQVARRLASAVGIDAGEVIVMAPHPVRGHPSWMCVTDVDDAAVRRTRWSATGRLTFVAVSAEDPLGLVDGLGWYCTALDVLNPDQTRLAVSADQGVDDIEVLMRSLAPIAAVEVDEPAIETSVDHTTGATMATTLVG